MVTNKDFKQYVINCINTEAYEIEAHTDRDKLKVVLDSFNREYNYLNNKKRFKNLVIRIAEWLKGGPTIISIEIWNEDIIKVAKEYKLLPKTTDNEEYNFVEYWFELVASTLLKLAKELRINTNYLN